MVGFVKAYLFLTNEAALGYNKMTWESGFCKVVWIKQGSDEL